MSILSVLVIAVLVLWLRWCVTRQPYYYQADYKVDAEQAHILAEIAAIHVEADTKPLWSKISFYREVMERLGQEVNTVSTIVPSGGEGAPKGEWLLPPHANPKRRILYIHGGGWSAGSPQSHRRITDQFALLANACVFAIDYRLIPEHSYLTGLKDCQQAYLWLLEHGPQGPGAADFMVIAGDSAGGSHTLALLTWIRDRALPSPSAAVALSPATDLLRDSLRKGPNVARDPLLGPIVAPLAWLPKPLLWLGLALLMRTRPGHPWVSPLRAELQQLTPTLIQASDSEILLEGIEAYTKKARAAGSSVELQRYPNKVHVWHIFSRTHEPAFSDIADFLARIEAKTAQV
ncbi:alpha/beta hydrolase [Oceanisphaera avium]|uniref:Alpha/beta hydrolase fold-3 domain-containing protein n=1 Tax=Oceanisphaera avium TaxID=1903694 RepID=A0A1Y0CWU8_9GAMM|nr:alpha/beta hydrolase [Oceanisphaera avium]ART79366.1 hypothetical protein CBP12_03720 [Oceanisphaera avium]